MKPWHHWVFAVVVGYILGYYFRQVGNQTLGRLAPGMSAAAASLG